MVMRAPVWGDALDEICSPDSLLVVPTPAGRLFDQATAVRWSGEEHLVFARGRYGIDQRVVDDAARRMRVEEVSIGDVLLGGETAALVMIEAVVRLLPDVIGQSASRTNRIRSRRRSGDAPSRRVTPPAELAWPRRADVLLSGDHARVEAWRRDESLRRTRERRPDLLDGRPGEER